MWGLFPFRTDDLKEGTLIGEDKYGNKYFENNKYFYGESVRLSGKWSAVGGVAHFAERVDGGVRVVAA